MSSKPNIYEALSPYADPIDAALSLQALANAIDKAARRCGSTELTAREVLKPLGLSTPIELQGLKAHGLAVYRRGTAWCIDSRTFRRWTETVIAQLKRKPVHQAPRVFGQAALF
jgi:hypothetical protein